MWTNDVVDALGLLTRLPVPSQRRPQTRAVWAYPLIGVLVGAVGGSVYNVCLCLGMAPIVAAVWVVAAQILLTGGLHEDGLADTVDGFGAGGDVARKLVIMRDSRIGAFGALALLVVILARVASVSTHSGWPALLALAASGASGRAAMVVLLVSLRPARDDGMAAALYAPPVGAAAVAAAVAIAIDCYVGWQSLVVTFVVCGLMGIIARRHINGYTGDVLGACEQIVEAAVLSVAA